MSSFVEGVMSRQRLVILVFFKIVLCSHQILSMVIHFVVKVTTHLAFHVLF